MKALIGKKLGMSQIVTDDGSVVPVTIIQAGPCVVTQLKTEEADGYSAVQVGFGENKKLNKPQVGHAAKAKISPRMMKEFAAENNEEVAIGDSFNVGVFQIGDVVKVTGISKGKGFAGTIKRWNFHRQNKTHGGKGDTRRPGSIGSMYPQKIIKGKKMAGRMGAAQVTVKNLKVEYIDEAENVIALKGAIPGPRKSLVTIEGIN